MSFILKSFSNSIQIHNIIGNKACLILFIAIGCLSNSTQAQSLERYEYENVQMGTNFRIILYATGDSLAKIASDQAFQKIKHLDDILSDYKKDSELNRISQQSGSSNWISVSSPLYDVISSAQKVAKKTDGAFDITVGPYVQLWRKINRSYNPKLPSPDTLQKTSESVGYKNIQINKNRQAVKLLKPDMQLDPGGIAKGYATDKALEVLEAHGIQSALVDAGGDIRLGDPPPEKEGWKITIPRYSTEGEKQTIPLSIANKAIATSGDLYNYTNIQGERYSHIIDPHTGIGLTDQSKVTVIASDGITADSYASAVSVLGYNEGIKLLTQNSKLEGFIEINQNDKIKRSATPGFNQFKIERSR